MSAEIIKGQKDDAFDFAVNFADESRNEIRILQITDTQTIDIGAVRNETRDAQIRGSYFYDGNIFMEDRCYRQIRTLVEKTKPDLIVLTGDNVYGEFDDRGVMMKELCALMDSFGIPWAPVFGNHDNESTLGVSWQIRQFEEAKHCIFKRGSTSGNCNYNILVSFNGMPEYIIYMMDSNGCRYIGNPGAPEEGMLKSNPDYDRILQKADIYPDQTEWYRHTAELLQKTVGKRLPQIVCLHEPIHAFTDAYIQKYHMLPEKDETFDTEMDGDCGYIEEYENFDPDSDGDFYKTAKALGLAAILTGHNHNNASCVHHDGVFFVFGMKTGTVTYPPRPRHTGGTLLCLEPQKGVLNCRMVPVD